MRTLFAQITCESFQILNQSVNAFELTENLCRSSGLIKEFRKDGTPEGVTRMENVEELLNGIKDFVEGQQELANAKAALSDFLEDVALATDLDKKEDSNVDNVALMTIHLA